MNTISIVKQLEKLRVLLPEYDAAIIKYFMEEYKELFPQARQHRITTKFMTEEVYQQLLERLKEKDIFTFFVLKIDSDKPPYSFKDFADFCPNAGHNFIASTQLSHRSGYRGDI